MNYWNGLVNPNTTLREYQLRICESAAQQNNNSIVVLPTGSGKTLIATTLAAHHKFSKNGKTLFVVPTQILVSQQGGAISKDTNLRVSHYHGELTWPNNITIYDVLVTTPESFRLKLASGDAKLGNYSLVVFDEVHHVMKKHPYRKLARLLELEPIKPQILGLTATCTYAVGESKIATDITKLCEALAITNILSASQEELVQGNYHGGRPDFEVHSTTKVTSNTPPLNDDLEEDTFDVFDTPKNESKFPIHQIKEEFFHSIKTGVADPLILRLMGLTRSVESVVKIYVPTFSSPLDGKGSVTEWAKYVMKKMPGAPHTSFLVHLYEALRLLVVTRSDGLDLVLEYLRMTIDDVHYAILGNLAPILDGIMSDGNNKIYFQRFSRLEGVLVKQLEIRGVDFRGILFVQQRLTTHILKNYIDHSPILTKKINADCIYATSSEASPYFRVTSSQSKERIENFRAGKLNLLISTAVAEEGMDIPAANCVIRFDPILTPVSFVQGRGRARQEKSSFVILEEREDRTAAQLAQSEKAQMEVINSKKVNISTDQAKRDRLLAQKNRENAAKTWLSTAAGVATAIVKTYAKKTDREVLEFVQKSGSEWKVKVSLLGFEGEKMEAEDVSPSKQIAKNNAFNNLLLQLKGVN